VLTQIGNLNLNPSPGSGKDLGGTDCRFALPHTADQKVCEFILPHKDSFPFKDIQSATGT